MFGESEEVRISLARLEKVAKPLYFVLRGIMVAFIVGWSLFFFAFFVSLTTPGFDLPHLAGQILCGVPAAMSALVSVSILYVVGTIFGSIRHGGTPFTIPIARQIKIVSLLLLASFFLDFLVSAIPLDDYSLGIVRIGIAKQGDGVIANLSVSTLVASMIGFVLSYVFKYGALLQQLSDDTI